MSRWAPVTISQLGRVVCRTCTTRFAVRTADADGWRRRARSGASAYSRACAVSGRAGKYFVVKIRICLLHLGGPLHRNGKCALCQRAAVERSRRRYPLRHLAAVRQWRANNPEKEREAYQRRYAKHPEKFAHWAARRRVRRYRAEGHCTVAEFDALICEQGWRCAYCYRALSDNGLKPERDHKTPLSRGGTHWPQNIQAVCGRCNRSKGARTHFEMLTFLWREVSARG